MALQVGACSAVDSAATESRASIVTVAMLRRQGIKSRKQVSSFDLEVAARGLEQVRCRFRASRTLPPMHFVLYPRLRFMRAILPKIASSLATRPPLLITTHSLSLRCSRLPLSACSCSARLRRPSDPRCARRMDLSSWMFPQAKMLTLCTGTPTARSTPRLLSPSCCSRQLSTPRTKYQGCGQTSKAKVSAIICDFFLSAHSPCCQQSQA